MSISQRSPKKEDAIPQPPKKRRKPSRKKKDVPCKNPECTNKLSGRQRDYCSRACSQKMYRERERARKDREKKKTQRA